MAVRNCHPRKVKLGFLGADGAGETKNQLLNESIARKTFRHSKFPDSLAYREPLRHDNHVSMHLSVMRNGVGARDTMCLRLERYHEHRCKGRRIIILLWFESEQRVLAFSWRY